MAADVLATQGARTSAAMILTLNVHTQVSYVVNTMAADVVATQGARISAAMILTFNPT